jgi:hypothetical protein
MKRTQRLKSHSVLTSIISSLGAMNGDTL